jgi:hypothetical protein
LLNNAKEIIHPPAKETKDLRIKMDYGVLECIGNEPLTGGTRVHIDSIYGWSRTGYPIYMSNLANETELLILQCHQEVGHRGLQDIMARLRENYWVPKTRATIKRVIFKECKVCRVLRAKPFKMPILATLPRERREVGAIFKNVGLDYAGPFIVKSDDCNTQCKVWVNLITCLVTRLTYLDCVWGLSAKTFLNSMRRFFGEHGKPRFIMSDNARHFKLTHEVFDEVFSKEISR